MHIEEWHLGDEGWVFEVGATVRIYCDALDAERLGWLLEQWDEDSLRDVRYSVGDIGGGEQLLAGVITGITALECRYPSPAGGRPIPGSGTARQVRQARGWTGDVDATQGSILAFVIDIELTT